MEYFYSDKFIDSALIIIFVGAIILFFDHILKKYFSKNKDGKDSLANNVWRAIKIFLIILLVLVVLDINGVRMGRYFAGLGIASALIGFALQDPIKDIISGISILLENKFKVGDVVIFGGEIGKVTSFNLKTTTIFMINDERTEIICNGEIKKIARAGDWIDIDVPIGYDVDLELSRSLCREAAKRIERLRYVYSCDFLNTQNLAESWIEYKLRIHCLPEKRPTVRRNSLAVVQDVFYENGMEFPLSIKVLYAGEGFAESSKILPHAVKNIRKSADLPQRKKPDYELGRGADKSKICKIDGSREAINRAINEAERYASSENLGRKMKTRIRLLSEEIVSMTHILTEIENGEFYIQREDCDYEICFEAEAGVSKAAHEKLIAVSTSGTNEAYEGVSGLIRKAVDTMILQNRADKFSTKKPEENNAMNMSIVDDENDVLRWSFNHYKNSSIQVSSENEDSTQDILPEAINMSILSQFSDDIKIAVRTNHIDIRILVKNIEE